VGFQQQQSSCALNMLVVCWHAASYRITVTCICQHQQMWYVAASVLTHCCRCVAQLLLLGRAVEPFHCWTNVDFTAFSRLTAISRLLGWQSLQVLCGFDVLFNSCVGHVCNNHQSAASSVSLCVSMQLAITVSAFSATADVLWLVSPSAKTVQRPSTPAAVETCG
jgi:hypothetical protein